ncbi:MAG: peptidoglycan-associated lipoprotein Pal [Hyphomicrobiales bacterium]|nr:peptidoglycan-associated lipoprotein Pal [Hyphomicrobiales bacterium]MCP5371683.1 peptidoglycan-associated lipoprotein Pal [Hyphomicrobiales bacterium]
MRFKFLSLFAAVILVAACETAPENSGASSGTGGGTTTTTSTATTTTVQPQGPAPGSQEDLVVNIGDRVFFDFDKYNLKADARGTLEKQAAWLTKFPAVSIVVEGHCDERGTREYNLALGERRANSVKDYLVALGVAPNRIRTISYGKERPVALGSNEAAWAQNRRGVTLVAGPGS